MGRPGRRRIGWWGSTRPAASPCARAPPAPARSAWGACRHPRSRSLPSATRGSPRSRRTPLPLCGASWRAGPLTRRSGIPRTRPTRSTRTACPPTPPGTPGQVTAVNTQTVTRLADPFASLVLALPDPLPVARVPADAAVSAAGGAEPGRPGRPSRPLTRRCGAPRPSRRPGTATRACWR